jgi:hypothetical protein
MSNEQAINYLKSSGFTDDQIKEVEQAITFDFLLWLIVHYEIEDMKLYELEDDTQWEIDEVVKEYLDVIEVIKDIKTN